MKVILNKINKYKQKSLLLKHKFNKINRKIKKFK